ncbi:MAG: DUF4836 family protein [Rikenellaceae bacterium]|nr:DUF4836 family protein [Rikenellaceae bacterium]MCL2692457.1 DUF4836 family protein [Rikenellaceae bacterium]
MKKLNFCSKMIFTAVLAVMMLASCNRRGAHDYRHAIPADAFMVISFNPAQLAHKAGVGEFTHSPLFRMMEREDAPAWVMAYIAEPSRTGLNTEHDFFVFMENPALNYYGLSMSGGLVAKVKDRKKVVEFVETLLAEHGEDNFEVIEIDGRTIVKPLGGGPVLAFTNETFILFANDFYDGNVSLARIETLLAQRREQSVMGQPHAAEMLNRRHDMGFVMNFTGIMSIAKAQMGAMGGMMLPQIDWLDKMSIMMSCDFEKGRIVSDMKIAFTDREAEKQFREMSESNRRMSGHMTKFLPAGSIATFGGGMNGVKTLEILQQTIPMLSMGLAMVPQAKTIIEAIDGDLIVSFNGMFPNSMPLVTLMTDVKNVKVVEVIHSLVSSAFHVREIENFSYQAQLGNGLSIWFGLHDEMLYASTDPNFTMLLRSTGGESMHEHYGHLFRGNYGAFVADFNALRSFMERMIATSGMYQFAGILPVIGMFNDLQLWQPTIFDIKMETTITDRDRNAAETIWRAMERAINL